MCAYIRLLVQSKERKEGREGERKGGGMEEGKGMSEQTNE